MKPLLPCLLWLCVGCGAQQLPPPDPDPEPAPVYQHQFAPPPQTLFRPGTGGGGGDLAGTWYTVKKGDFISAIAQRNGVPVEDVVEINGLTHPEKLEVGQTLFLVNVDRPSAGGAVKAAGGGAAQQSQATVTVNKRRVAFIWPVRTGEIVSNFGKRGNVMHKGIDIKAPLKTKVYAIADGTVIYSNNTQPGYGNLIIIRHDKDVVSVYAHNRVNRVDEGDRVRQGQEIAEVGQSGRAKTPHLHFELRVKGKAQNPLVRLPATNNLNR